MTQTGIARRIAWWSLLGMVFLVPLVMSDFALPGMQGRLTFSSVELVKLSLLMILALISLGSWAIDLLRQGGSVRHSPVSWLVLAWLIWVVVTTFTALHWPTAFLGTQGRYEGLITFVTYAVVYFLALQFVDENNRVVRLAQVLLSSGLIISIYGLLQHAGVVSLPQDLPWNEANRAFATYGNPIILGGFLIFVVNVALALALGEHRMHWRLLYWSAFGLGGLTLLVTYTRGAWVGATVSVALTCIFALRQRARLRRWDLAPLGLFAGAALALILRSGPGSEQQTDVAERITTGLQFSTGSGLTRTFIWQAAKRAIEERPLLGWGADNFGFAFNRYKPAEFVHDLGGSVQADNAHSYPLHLAASIGILGAVAFYAIWIWAGIRSFRTLFARAGGPGRLLRAAFWASAAGYLVHLVLGISVPGITFLLWISLAVVLAPTARSLDVAPRRPVAKYLLIAVVTIAVTLGIAGQAVALAADRDYVAATDEFSGLTPSERRALAERAVSLNPLVPEYRSTVGTAGMAQMRLDSRSLAKAEKQGGDVTLYREALVASLTQTETALEAAIGSTPDDYANYVNLVTTYNIAGASLDPAYYEQAIAAAERGLEVMPLGTDIRVRLAEAYVGLGRKDEAIGTLEYCVELDSGGADAVLALARLYEERGMIDEALAMLEAAEEWAPGQPGIAEAIRSLEQGMPLQ